MRFQQADAQIDEHGEDDLVRRLRALDWPEADAQARLRCWHALEDRLGPLAGVRTATENGRADFSRRRPALFSTVVSARVSAIGRVSVSTRA
jgi:hypothetical protein